MSTIKLKKLFQHKLGKAPALLTTGFFQDGIPILLFKHTIQMEIVRDAQ